MDPYGVVSRATRKPEREGDVTLIRINRGLPCSPCPPGEPFAS